MRRPSLDIQEPARPIHPLSFEWNQSKWLNFGTRSNPTLTIVASIEWMTVTSPANDCQKKLNGLKILDLGK
jgi:hypothetical protein